MHGAQQKILMATPPNPTLPGGIAISQGIGNSEGVDCRANDRPINISVDNIGGVTMCDWWAIGKL